LNFFIFKVLTRSAEKSANLVFFLLKRAVGFSEFLCQGEFPKKKVLPPVEKALLPVKKALLPVKKALLPVKKALLPVEKALLPVEKAFLPVEKVLLPVEKALLPVKKALLLCYSGTVSLRGATESTRERGFSIMEERK